MAVANLAFNHSLVSLYRLMLRSMKALHELAFYDVLRASEGLTAVAGLVVDLTVLLYFYNFFSGLGVLKDWRVGLVIFSSSVADEFSLIPTAE